MTLFAITTSGGAELPAQDFGELTAEELLAGGHPDLAGGGGGTGCRLDPENGHAVVEESTEQISVVARDLHDEGRGV